MRQLQAHFADRLLTAVVSQDSLDVAALHHAVRPVGAKSRLPSILDVVRLAHRRPTSKKATDSLVRELNGKLPAPIVTQEQHELLALLAASSLIELFSEAGDRPAVTAAALAVKTVKRGGWTAAHGDLDLFADAFLKGRASASRQRRALPKLPQPLAKMISLVEPSRGEQAAHYSWPRTLREFKSIRATVEGLHDGLHDLGEAYAHNQAVAAEQQDMLWWMLSAPPSASAFEAGLDAAAELGAILRFAPAPRALEQVLRRRLGNQYDLPVLSTDLADTDAESGRVFEALVGVPSHAVDFAPVVVSASRGSTPGLAMTTGEFSRALLDELQLVRLIDPNSRKEPQP
jgi:hypothetical protein